MVSRPSISSLFAKSVALQVRALDNVLDVTFWPLPQQDAEAKASAASAWISPAWATPWPCCACATTAPRAAPWPRALPSTCATAAYGASVELAREKGAFPSSTPTAASPRAPSPAARPPRWKKQIRQHGIRNSHLLSIAPTGTVSLAFADNASNGIEPPFSWMYKRKKREADGSMAEYAVEDHAWRLYREAGRRRRICPNISSRRWRCRPRTTSP